MVAIGGNENNTWIRIKSKKEREDSPTEIRIDMDGKVYIDGKLYDERTSKYRNLSVDVEIHNKLNSGEETRKIIEKGKSAKKGDIYTIKDIEEPNRKESTTVKF